MSFNQAQSVEQLYEENAAYNLVLVANPPLATEVSE